VADAITVFQRNVELFPGGYNTYDSLGEAYLVQGDTAQAITNYRRSVAMNPRNQNGRAVLSRLGVEP
jgi:cytochrome c-type biogenesis protein CcmH/NrfG